MLSGIEPQRVVSMAQQERRWLDNARKAFHDSDILYQSGRPEEGSIQLLCIAVELSAKLRDALMDTTPAAMKSRKTFLAFVDTDIPRPEDGGLAIAIDGWGWHRKPETPMSFADMLYEIRCAYAHEYDNLNAAESPGKSVAIDWSGSLGSAFGAVQGGNQFVVDGHQLWHRLRGLMAKFLTGIEAYEGVATKTGFSITVSPALGTIRNARRM